MKVSLSTQLSELSEEQIIAILRTSYPKGDNPTEIDNDDAAVVSVPVEARLATSSDVLIENEDFVFPEFSAYDVGWKTAAVNLSDIGAMGSTPTGLLVTLGINRRSTVAELVGYARGVREAVARISPEVSIWGGDLSNSALMISQATSYGVVTNPISRSGAQVGDVIAYAGQLGYAAAGLRILVGQRDRSAELQGVERTGIVERAVEAQLRPTPPVALGAVAAAAGAHAMIDVSDGLARDGARIGLASEVTLDFASSALSGHCAELGWVRHTLNVDPWELVMAGGEDFGLLATFAKGANLPAGFEVIGEVVPRGEHGVLLSGRQTEYLGFDHFSGSH